MIEVKKLSDIPELFDSVDKTQPIQSFIVDLTINVYKWGEINSVKIENIFFSPMESGNMEMILVLRQLTIK